MIKFEVGVRQFKIAQSKAESNIWEMADICATLEPKYGKRTLEKFAQEVGLSASTIKHYRSTALAWPKEKKGGRPPFWTAKVLAPLPDREKLIERKPNMTRAEARGTASERRRTQKRQEREKYDANKYAELAGNILDSWRNDTNFRDYINRAIAGRHSLKVSYKRHVMKNLEVLIPRLQQIKEKLNEPAELRVVNPPTPMKMVSQPRSK